MAKKKKQQKQQENPAGIQIPQVYNATYKDIFSVKEIFADLLKGFVPPTMLGGFSYKSLQRMQQDFISSILEERRNDLLWRVRAGSAQWNYILILNEFQSKKDSTMPVRLFEYEGVILHGLYKEKILTDKDKLPHILAIVIYNGGPEWDCPLSLTEMRGGIAHPDFERYQPQLEYLVIDINKQHEAYKDKNNIAALFLRLDSAKNPAVFLDAFNDVCERLKGDKYLNTRETIKLFLIASVLPRLGLQKEIIQNIQTLDEVSDMLNVSMDEWKQQYINQGLLQGMKATRQEVWDQATRVANEAAAKNEQRLTQEFQSKIQDSQSKIQKLTQEFQSKIQDSQSKIQKLTQDYQSKIQLMQKFMLEKGFTPEEIAAFMA